MIKLNHKLAAALVLACSFGSSAVFAADTLRFGLEAQYPPFESKSSTGELQGLDIDVGNAVCVAAKMTCKWVETSFDGLIPALQGRKFDAINSAMNATDAAPPGDRFHDRRVSRADATDRQDRQRLAADTGIAEGQERRRVARIDSGNLRQGALGEQRRERRRRTRIKTRRTPISSPGGLDGTLVLAPAGQTGFLSKPDGKGYSFAGAPVRDDKILGSGIAYGVRKGDDALKAKLNAAIDKVKADGTIDKYAKKYLGDIDISAK